MLRKVYFYSSVASIYVLTVGVIGAMLYPPHLFGTSSDVSNRMQTHPVHLPRPVEDVPRLVSGTPIRIVIPSRTINLPIDQGQYNERSKTWTLSPIHAEFAASSMPANNYTGATFVYGHGTDAVFGKIGTNPPPIGSIAQIQTDTGLTFLYTLKSIKNFNPTDTSILNNVTSGPPRLIVQTCTGMFSQWRTEFTFTFQKVE